MRLSEIQRDGIKEWLNKYLADNRIDDVTSIVKSIDANNGLYINQLLLGSKGSTFVSPPFQIHADYTKLSDYDFENSTYANISTKDLALVGRMNDIEKVVTGVKKSFKRLADLQITAFSNNARNVVSAISMVDKFDMYVQIMANDYTLSINTFDQSIYTDVTNRQTYEDVFDLQDILINMGFEALV
ncbi:hypothetical protein RsoM2USA_305 [Ralstonia phage RsoM2USA]|nr:hypothetical protein RsoM2USA_305 [Ralstonia phage RsoM2USA]